MTTTYGIDVSHYQGSLSVIQARKARIEYLIAKCTDGAGFADPAYDSFRAQARDNGLLFAAYHFLRSDSSPASQADNLAAHIGDKSIPVFIDLEPSGASKPTLRHAAAFRAACANRGLKVTVLYFPHFWWAETGSPSLAGWTLWQATYGTNLAGSPDVLYPGDKSTRWNKQGGVTPTLLQYGSRGVVPGFNGSVDVDAFRGTRDELAALGLFKDYAPAVPPKKRVAHLYPAVKKALATNEQHANDLRAIKRVPLSPLDLSIRSSLRSLRRERRALLRRLNGVRP